MVFRWFGDYQHTQRTPQRTPLRTQRTCSIPPVNRPVLGAGPTTRPANIAADAGGPGRQPEPDPKLNAPPTPPPPPPPTPSAPTPAGRPGRCCGGGGGGMSWGAPLRRLWRARRRAGTHVRHWAIGPASACDLTMVSNDDRTKLGDGVEGWRGGSRPVESHHFRNFVNILG